MKSSLAIPRKGIIASKTITAASKERPDLSEAVKLGKACIEELRSVLPGIADNPKYRSSKAWSDWWYVDFLLGVHVTDDAYEYANEHCADRQDPLWAEAYWSYIDDLQDKCKAIADKYSNEDYKIYFHYFNPKSGGTYSGPNSATLTVFDARN